LPDLRERHLWSIRKNIEKERRSSFSRKAAKHAKSGNGRSMNNAAGIAKTLDQTLVIHAVHYAMLLL